MSDEATQACTLAIEPEEDVGGGKQNGWAILKSLNPTYPDFALCDKEISIGRQPNSTIHFNDMNISGRHCTIKKESEEGDAVGPIIAFLYDQSTNGTYIDGIKVGKGNRCLLTTGQEIALVLSKKQGQEKIAFIYQNIEKEDDEDGGPQKKYHIGETLGVGNFATVKLAVDKKTGAKFAIKIIDKKKYSMTSSARKDSLMDEVIILTQLNHPNIIHIQEVFNTERTLYLVLELVECGELLNDILTCSFYKEDKAKKFFKQIVNAVKYLHDQGIAHRDLKPENILLKHRKEELDDAIKLSDFGLSRSISEGSFMKTMCGTPQYLAPEILTNGSNGAGGYGKEVDCWSMGAILYVMLSGYPPFDDSQDTSIFEQIRNAVFEFPDDEWKNVSAEAKDLIKRLLTVNPLKRYTCEQILEHPWYNTKVTLAQLIEKDKELNDRYLGKRKSEDGIMIKSDSNNGTTEMSQLKKSKSENNVTQTTNNGNTSNNNILIVDDDSDTDEEIDQKMDLKPISPIKQRTSSNLSTMSTSSESNSRNNSFSSDTNNISKSNSSSSINTSISNPSPPLSPTPTSPKVSPKVFAVPAPKQASAPPSPQKELPWCMYGEKCYRKNPQHFKEYRHPNK